MTVIAWDGKVIAIDKQLTAGGFTYTGSKCRRLEDGTILAWSGDSDAAGILVDWFVSGAGKESFPFEIKRDPIAELVVLKDGVASHYQESPFPMKNEMPFMAWGCGREFAMGAMEMGADAIRAVAVASKYSDGCGRGVDWFEL